MTIATTLSAEEKNSLFTTYFNYTGLSNIQNTVFEQIRSCKTSIEFDYMNDEYIA